MMVKYSNHAFLVLFVVKPWLICGYGGLTMVNMLFWFYLWLRWFNYGKHAFFGFICSKTMVNLWLQWFNYGKHAFFGFICSKTMVNLWLRWFNYSKHAFLVLFVVKPWLICGYDG